MNFVIVTTINDLNENIIKFTKIDNFKTIIIGDVKSSVYEYNNLIFLSFKEQLNLDFLSINNTPENHHSRKNIGYLYAINNDANIIYESDDDTYLNSTDFLKNLKFENNRNISSIGSNTLNIYNFFTRKNIWHRGFDLTKINDNLIYNEDNLSNNIGVWQGLINGDTDVDAIYRLTNKDIEVIFDDNIKLSLNKGTFSPFNTQNTLWRKECFILLYLPVTVNFRFTDILRGYVAQKIMWEYNYLLGFHSPDTFQIRNKHDYFKDFLDEIFMYVNIPKIIKILNEIKLTGECMANDLYLIYEKLYNENIVNKSELISVKNWIEDYNNINNKK